MGTFLSLVVILRLAYRFRKFMYWFLWVNVDEKGQDQIERFINNVFYRVYAKNRETQFTNW